MGSYCHLPAPTRVAIVASLCLTLQSQTGIIAPSPGGRELLFVTHLSAIDREVAWVCAHVGLGPDQAVLDLGCGPGLYCERLARHGLHVTGVDLSPTAIGHAERHARETGLAINYVQGDYRSLDTVDRFDAAVLIYLDFGVLSDPDRDQVLARVHGALKAGGALVFDVATPDYPAPPEGTLEWAITSSGFWRAGPYLELTGHYRYPEADARLTQTVVVDADGRASVYRLWDRAYTPHTIARVLEARGFRVQDLWGDLTGTPYAPGCPMLGVVARKS